MVDAIGRPSLMQMVPMARLIRVDHRHAGDDLLGNLNAVGFGRTDKQREGAALALAQRDHDAAGAGLVFG